MKQSHFEHRVACISIAAAMLAGCGGSQPPIGAPGAMPQSRAHQMSGSSGDLLYVAEGPDVLVFSYPEDKLVGHLVSGGWGSCSDTNGNVFVTNDSGVLEYAHGGTNPINTLNAHGAFSCSWDPSTGNLAVVERPISIAIFRGASGTPQTYTDTSFIEFAYCAYDDKGHLFVTGVPTGPYSYSLVELDIRSGSFKTITLNEKVDYLEDLHWDGKYLAIDDFYGTGTIDRVQVSGSSGTIKARTNLSGARNLWRLDLAARRNIHIPSLRARQRKQKDRLLVLSVGGKTYKEIAA